MSGTSLLHGVATMKATLLMTAGKLTDSSTHVEKVTTSSIWCTGAAGPTCCAWKERHLLGCLALAYVFGGEARWNTHITCPNPK